MLEKQKNLINEYEKKYPKSERTLMNKSRDCN